LNFYVEDENYRNKISEPIVFPHHRADDVKNLGTSKEISNLKFEIRNLPFFIFLSPISFFLLLFFLFFQFSNAELLIGDINFEGNYFITDKELLSTISSDPGGYFSQKMLNEDVQRISDFYVKKGFYQIKIHSPEINTISPEKIDVLFKIEENEKMTIAELILKGNRYISENKILESNPAKNIDLKQLSILIQNIAEYYAFNGFLFADVKIDSLVLKNNQTKAYISISEGDFCEFEEYKFKGNKTTRSSTLLKISQIDKIEKVNPMVLNRAAELIRKKEYIHDCSLIPLNHKQLLFNIEEDRMTYLSGILGYDNSQEKKNRLTGFVNLDFLNLFGTDRSISLRWEKLSFDRSLIELKYHESGPFSYPVSGDFSIYREEVDSTYTKSSYETEIYLYSLINRYGIYLGVDEIFPGTRRPIIIDKTSYKKAGIFWNFNNTDYYLNPTKGNDLLIKYFYIFNRINSENISKQAVEAKLINFRKIFQKLIFAIGLNANVLENKSLSELEYYFLGGNSSLRGFNENQFYGYRVGWSNLELRYLLSRNSRAFLFTDYGYVESEEYKFGLLFGFGFGLRVETKLGLLGIDYGLSYQGGEFRNPLDGIIHFGIEMKM